MSTVQRVPNVRTNTAHAGAGSLRTVLARLLRRLRWLSVGTRLLLGVAWVTLAVWLAIGVDALTPLASGPRGVLRLVLPVLALVLLAWSVWPRRARPRANERGAAMVEDALRLDDQPLATSLTLHDRAHRASTTQNNSSNSTDAESDDDAFAAALRARAHARADAAVRSGDAVRAAPLARLSRPLGWLWLTLVLWGVMVLLFPALPGIGLRRLLMPGADVPPFSLTRLAVSWYPDEPMAGEDVTVVVGASGIRPDDVVMVFLDDEHRPVERRPMVRVGPDAFRATLANLTEPVTFHLEAHGRRTKRYTLAPEQPPPPPPGDDDDDGTPDPTATQAQSSDGGTGQPDNSPGGGDDTQPGGDDNTNSGTGDGALSDEASALMGELADLINDLADLAEQARRSGEPGGPSMEELLEQLEGIAERSEDLAERFGEAADAAGASPELAEALARLAAALEGMESPGMLPGGTNAPGTSSAPGGGQPGFGESLAESASADAQGLAQGLGQSQRDIASGLSSHGGNEGAPDFRDPSARGGYDETIGGADDGVLPEALMQQVPPRYRDQTAAYFRHLAESQRDAPRSSPEQESP